MDINRAWMYDMYENRQIKLTFLKGVDDFLNFATSQAHFMDGEKIKCPCTKCRNCKFLLKDDVEDHLYRHGFFPDYYWWTAHGEPFVPVEPSVPPLNREQISRDNRRGSYEHLNAEERMVFDIAGPSFFPPTEFRHNASSIPTDGIHYHRMETHDFVNEVNEDMMTDAVPTDEEARWSERFYNVLKAADQPVYPGCNTHTQLSFVSRLLSLKSEHNMSESLFNGFLQLYDEVLPSGHKIPRDYYQAKKVFQSLELPVKKIHMCPNGCMLYWKENADAKSCKFCGHDRYERKGSQKSRIPHQVLRYFPLTPRLQRLYAAEATAHAMSWHARCVPDEGIMSHPSHGDAWKKLDATYPNFASEPRNVRLGLCTDGFAPFSTSGRTYSCWPVIVTPYNLPPDMCMKRQYLFLSMIVPGPRNPKKLIDVCLQPLVDELIQLWECGATTFDASRKENFVMRATLLWTINDFPAYAMLSGWSTAGILACTYCMERTNSFRLEHGKKACWFDCSWPFLELNHAFRKNKKDFFVDRVERSPAPPMLTGEQIWERVCRFPTAIDEPHNEPPGYGTFHKWTKQRKTKDNLNARKDLGKYCHRPELQVDTAYTGVKPKAIYALTRDQKKKVFDWVKALKFPDGYASNVSRCVQIDDCKLIGMKSHDCHVFMERLLPIAFRELLPALVWGPLAELSFFFQSICSSSLSIEHMVQLKSMTPVLMCKLERIFPPAFFDSMEHLILHLPHEAQICGPVQYRWMYPFERFLGHLKRKIKQPGRVEGSICEAYLKEESANFSEHYFQPHVPSKLRQPTRNNDIFEEEEEDQTISIFNYPGRHSGKEVKRWLTDAKELHAAHTYILRNCEEVDEYIEKFALEKGGADDDKIDEEFAGWFKSHVLGNNSLCTNDFLYSLAWGPNGKAKSWPTYFVNGYKFHTVDHGVGKSTMNSGVCVKGCNYENAQSNFYGLLEEIIELEYINLPSKPLKVVLFKCRWFNPRDMSVDPSYHITEVNHKKLYKKYEPFILEQQAVQVYYTNYPGARRGRADMWDVCKTVPRSTIEEHWSSGGLAYQSSEIATPDDFEQMAIEEMPEHLGDPLGSVDSIDEENIVEPAESDDEESSSNTSEDIEMIYSEEE